MAPKTQGPPSSRYATWLPRSSKQTSLSVTLAEATSVADLEAVSWHILIARTGTPGPVADKLHNEMKRIMAAPDVRQKVEAIGLIPHETPSIEGMRRYVKAEADKWGALVRSLGLEGSE